MDDEHRASAASGSTLEFIVYQYPRTKEQIESESAEWCVLDEQSMNSTEKEDNFELIQIRDDCIIVTIKPKDQRQESFLQKATGTVDLSRARPCLQLSI